MTSAETKLRKPRKKPDVEDIHRFWTTQDLETRAEFAAYKAYLIILKSLFQICVTIVV